MQKTRLWAALSIASVLSAQSVLAWPDLLVVKTGPTNAVPGEVITYTLRYTNIGPVKSTSVVLKDTLPSYVSALTNTLNGGTLSNGVVSWSIGTLNSKAGGLRTFQARINTNPPSPSYITNRAQVFGKEAEENGKTVNNYSSWITRITNAVSLNRAPTAANDNYSVAEDTMLTISALGVLVNDSDSDGNVLRAILVNPPAYGLLNLNTNGGFTYTPNPGYNGPDSFTYVANDGLTNSGIATANITVTPVNDAPQAVNDSYSTGENTALNVSAPGVLANDSDPDGDTLTAVVVAGPLRGTLSLQSNGGFLYTPATNYSGPDSFTYQASDGQTNSGIATVAITVTPAPVNRAPVALNDNYTIAEDNALNVSAPGVLGNDSDPDGNPLTALLITPPTNGVVNLTPDGSFTYTPAQDYNGQDSFTYRVSDGLLTSEVAVVNITVTPVNDSPPTPRSGTTFTVLEDGILDVPAPGVLMDVIDPDGDILTVALVSNVLRGTLTFNTNGAFIYTPNPDYNGPDFFVFTVSDGQETSLPQTASIAVIPVNDPPSFTKGENFSLQQSTPTQTASNWATNLSPGPTNESAQTLDFIVSNDNPAMFAAQPAIAPDGTLSFTPAAGQSGTAIVSVQLRDSGGTANGGVDTSATQTFTITINAPPTVQITSPTNGASFFVPGNFAVLADAQDVDGTVAKVEFFSGTNKVGETLSEPFFVVLTNLSLGNYTLNAIATDNTGATGSATPVTVSVIERPPLTFLTSVYYNPQKDFFEQRVRVTNPTYSTLDAIRVLVFNLTNNPPITVGNVSGYTNGVPYVQTHGAIPPGSHVDLTIEFLSPLRVMPNPILRAELVPPAGIVAPLQGTFQRINRGVMLANRTFLVEFFALSNRIYAVQYSEDLANWKTSRPVIPGEGTWIQWIDNGEPKTEGSPATTPARFYRLILLP